MTKTSKTSSSFSQLPSSLDPSDPSSQPNKLKRWKSFSDLPLFSFLKKKDNTTNSGVNLPMKDLYKAKKEFYHQTLEELRKLPENSEKLEYELSAEASKLTNQWLEECSEKSRPKK